MLFHIHANGSIAAVQLCVLLLVCLLFNLQVLGVGALVLFTPGRPLALAGARPSNVRRVRISVLPWHALAYCARH